MAIDEMTLDLIEPHLRGAAVLCLSYPDIILPVASIERRLGIKVQSTTKHGSAHKLKFDLPETVSTFLAAGCASVECVDKVRLRDCEEIVDLNWPLKWPREYDLVINPGTLEHCFNIGQAWKNAWEAVKEGGVLVHVAPCSMINHGFWNVNPTAYYDFADENGGEVIKTMVAVKTGAVNFDPRKRCALPSNAVVYSSVRKVYKQPVVWPTQWKYRGLGG